MAKVQNLTKSGCQQDVAEREKRAGNICERVSFARRA